MARSKTCNVCEAKIKSDENNIYPKECPHCGSDIWNMPVDEVILHKLQDQYMLYRDDKSFGAFLLGVKKILRNIIIGKLKSNSFIVQDDELDDLILDSLEKIIKLYNKPSFYIKDSFIGYFSQVVLYPMYNPKKKEYQKNEVSYNTPLKTSNTKITTEDEKTLLNYLEEQELSHDMDKLLYEDKLVFELLNLIEAIYKKTCQELSPQFGYILVFLLKEFFNNKKNSYFIEFFNYYKKDYFEYFEKSIIIIRNYITEYEKEGHL